MKVRYHPRRPADGPWYWVNRERAAAALAAGGSNCLLTYQGLCAAHARAGGRDIFKASLAGLDAITGLSPRTLSKHLGILEAAGLVDRRSGRHGGALGAHVASSYCLPHPAPASPEVAA